MSRRDGRDPCVLAGARRLHHRNIHSIGGHRTAVANAWLFHRLVCMPKGFDTCAIGTVMANPPSESRRIRQRSILLHSTDAASAARGERDGPG
jgi:hypothetical protein